jgi:hypothetical protein
MKRLLLIGLSMALLAGCANLNKRSLAAPCAGVGGPCGPSHPLNVLERRMS